MESEVKQRKELIMNRSISLLGGLLTGLVLCGCQTTQTSVRLGECPLRVEAWFPGAVTNGIAVVNINGVNVGTTYVGRGDANVKVADFDISLAPGYYRVCITSEGYEIGQETVSILGKKQAPNVRITMKPATPAPAK